MTVASFIFIPVPEQEGHLWVGRQPVFVMISDGENVWKGFGKGVRGFSENYLTVVDLSCDVM